MKYCPHAYLIPPELLRLSDSVKTGDLTDLKVSPFCLKCWDDPAKSSFFQSRFFEKPAADDPCSVGFCDIISQVVNRRGFIRDEYTREAKELDLRERLILKKTVIDAATRGKDENFIRGYIRNALRNTLKNDQTSSEGRIIAGSVKSLSPDPTFSRYGGKDIASDLLTDMTGGDSAGLNDDRTLDQRDALVQEPPDSDSPRKARKSKRSEARQLFDKLATEAASQIATLTGGRKDGFGTYLDLEKALAKLPDDERAVFECLYLENGEFLNRPRTYADAEFDLNLSLQNVRTLERRAIEKLRPILSQGFFKRRSLVS